MSTVEKPRKRKVEKAEPEADNDESPEVDTPVLSHKQQRKAKRAEEAGLAAPAPKLVDTAAPSQAAQAAKTSQHGVWIGNLNFTTSANALKNWLASALLSVEGEIVRVNMPSNQQGRNRGFAYVDFSNEVAQQAAIKASEGHLEGRKLLIKSSTDYSGRPAAKPEASVATDIAAILHEAPLPSTSKAAEATFTQTLSKKMKRIAAAQKNPPGPTLFLGNLGFETKEHDIRVLFDAHLRATLKWQPRAQKKLQKRASKKTAAKGKAQADKPDAAESDSDSSDAESGSDSEDEDESSSSSEDEAVEEDAPTSGIRQVRMGTFEDTGKCKGWAFVDFYDIKKATVSLLNPHNHVLNGRTLKVEYASAEAVRRGGNKQQKMMKSFPGRFKHGAASNGAKRSFSAVEAEPPKLEDIKLLTAAELEGPAPKKHKPTKEERQAAREQRQKPAASGPARARAAGGGKAQKVVFDEE